MMSLIYSKGEVCMDRVTIDSITEEYLKQRINNLRDVLNEICSTNSHTEAKLIVSRDLDELIARYMREMKS
jgi:hypothetical protein